MKNLPLQLINGEYRVDSRLLAVRLRNHHKNVMELIDRYLKRFKRFGVVPFQTEKPRGSKGGRPERYAELNEDQCYFLLSLSRNTDHVVDLKANLVQSFKKARTGAVDLSAEYLPGYHDLHDRIHVLANGSKNERFVHMNMNKLVNKTVGITSGQRGRLEAPVKSLTVVAQILAAKALEDAEDHHDGHVRAKQALERLGQVLTLQAA